MAKKITGYIKLQVSAGKANPAPPIGTALGPQGVNIMEFCKQFNAKSRSLFYVHHQDTARGRSSEEGGEDRKGFGQTEP